jgi:peptide/nickel transport system permease protein
MPAYLIRRILATIPVMIVVALFVFALLHLSPGDPAAVIAGDYASPADIERIRHQLGLDAPIHEQLGIWLWSVVRGESTGRLCVAHWAAATSGRLVSV